MSDFYRQTKALLWLESVVIFALGFYPALWIIEKGSIEPAFYLFIFLYVPLGQFAMTPILTLAGVYKYYSPMLLGYLPNRFQIDLHSGGSFDYLITMRTIRAGAPIRKKILIYHLEGLLNLITMIENKVIPESVSIVGTSYFFNQRTAQRLGFEIARPSMFYKLNLFINFIDLFWMFSLSRGKLSIPKIQIVKKLSIDGATLVRNKVLLIALHTKLKTG